MQFTDNITCKQLGRLNTNLVRKRWLLAQLRGCNQVGTPDLVESSSFRASAKPESEARKVFKQQLCLVSQKCRNTDPKKSKENKDIIESALL